jgi:hypothetical protein
MALCLAKTLHVPESMTWRRTCPARLSLLSPDFCAPSIPAQPGHLRLSFPRRTPPREPRPSATTADSVRCEPRTWSRISWSVCRVVATIFLFSAGSQRPHRGGTRHCSQICNWNFHEDQQRSTTAKMQPADFRGDNLYTRKVTHLISNQIPSLGETC